MGRKPKIIENPPIRIAITGPESTGKSTLAKELAFHYKTLYAREAARNYVRDINRDYNYFDLYVIALKQLSHEKRIARNAKKYMFCDTELTVIKIWAMHKFNKCHPFVLQKLEEVKYDLYLLCNTDLPWEYDAYREHPNLGQYFFEKYEQELINRKLPYVIISGKGKERLQNAINAVDALGK